MKFCRQNYVIDFQFNSLNYEIMKFIIHNGLMKTLTASGWKVKVNVLVELGQNKLQNVEKLVKQNICKVESTSSWTPPAPSLI